MEEPHTLYCIERFGMGYICCINLNNLCKAYNQRNGS